MPRRALGIRKDGRSAEVHPHTASRYSNRSEGFFRQAAHQFLAEPDTEVGASSCDYHNSWCFTWWYSCVGWQGLTCILGWALGLSRCCVKCPNGCVRCLPESGLHSIHVGKHVTGCAHRCDGIFTSLVGGPTVVAHQSSPALPMLLANGVVL